MSDPVPDDLARALAGTAARRGSFGEPLYFFSETGSTNDVAAALAEQGAGQGTTVVAYAQSAGRGRFGRTWFSPAGAGLYVSVVCRDPAAAPLLTLAGILAEASSGAEGLQYVILGFGINMRPAAYPAELADRATSIETELGRPIDGAFVLADTLAALAGVFARLTSGEAPAVLARWRELAPSA